MHVQNGGFPPPDYSLSGSASANASFSGYDVLLSGPSGQSTLTSLNLSFDGSAFVVADGAFGSASVSIGTSLSGPGGTATDSGALTADPITQVTTGSGLLSAWPGPVIPLGVITSSLLVEAGDVVTIGLGLGGQAECSTIAFASHSICPSLFDVPAFSFTATGPVFNLPDGWTANSLDGTIVNNIFVAPEPSTALLFSSGLLAMALRRRRGMRGRSS